MTPRMIVVGLKDPFMVLLVSKDRDVERHQFHSDPSPIKSIPDFDIVLESPSDSSLCIHAKRTGEEVKGDDGLTRTTGRYETIRCRNTRAKEMPNGYLCEYHQNWLRPVVRLDPRTKLHRKDWGEIDPIELVKNVAREVLTARENLADSEIHDHVTFERLKDVQLDEGTVKRYMSRRG